MVFNISQPIAPSNIFDPVNASNFDGTTAFLEKSASIISTQNTGIISFWFNTSSLATGKNIVRAIDASNRDGVFVATSSNVSLLLAFVPNGQSAGIGALVNTTGLADSKWHHVLCSWDNTGLLIKAYVDDISNYSATGLINAGALGTLTVWDIGRRPAGQGGGNFYGGGLSELYLKTGTYIDLDIVANRRKFISSTKRPIFLGNSGNIPTGTVPELYFKGSGTGFNVNSGSGGNFTTTGTLTTPTTTPSAP